MGFRILGLGHAQYLSLLLLIAWMFTAATTASAQCSFPFTPNGMTYDFSSPRFKTLYSQLDTAISQFVSENLISSYAVAVVHRNQTIYKSGLTTTPFRCASITKTFNCLGALMLRDRGRLSLDDPVVKFLPGFSVVNPYGKHNTTLRELMAHTSGLPEQFCPFRESCTTNETEVLQQIAGMQLIQRPWGRYPIYSNLGLALLGHAWEKATRPRVSWWDFIRDNVVRPLRLTNTGIDLTNVDLAPNADPMARQDLEWSAPAAQMYSTAEDLAKYLGFLITGSPALVSDASRREWIRPSKLFADSKSGYAMPWELGKLASNISSDYIIAKAGDINGYLSHMAFHPASELGVIVLTVYTDYLRPFPDALSNTILSTLIPEVQSLNNGTIARTYDGVYQCARSPAFASPTLNYSVSVLRGSIAISSNDSLGMSATFDVQLQNTGASPYPVGGTNSMMLKNATEDSFWFGNAAVCYWFLGGLSANPDLKSPNTPNSAYTDVLRFDMATSSVSWPTVGANCTRA